MGCNLYCLFYFLKVSGFPRNGPYFAPIVRKTFFYIYKHNCIKNGACCVRIVEKKERGGNACEIWFQKVIPPALSASNPNVVSGFKSCQSSNGRQTALFTELKKKICLYSSFIFVFCKRINPLPPKMKELASITRSTFSAVDFSLNRSYTSCCRFLLLLLKCCLNLFVSKSFNA